MSEWKAIRVDKPALTVIPKTAAKSRGTSGAHLSPWQIDRWSINPQSFSVVSSPSMSKRHEINNGYDQIAATGGFSFNFTQGLSMARLGTVFFLILSLFLFGMLLCVLLK